MSSNEHVEQMPHKHLAEYTRTMTGVPRVVWPGDKTHPTHVIFWVGAANTERVYTWSQWAAAFCERAYVEKKKITVAYSETSWGRLLIDVDFAEPPEPAA